MASDLEIEMLKQEPLEKVIPERKGKTFLEYPLSKSALLHTYIESQTLIKVGPKEEVSARSVQEVLSEVKVISDNTNTLQNFQWPFEITYKLLEYKVELDQKGVKSFFSIEDPSANYFFAELKQLKNKEIPLQLTKAELDFTVKDEHSSFYEILKNENGAHFLLHYLKEAFFLVGRPLRVGSTYEIPVSYGFHAPLKASLSFKVIEISPYEVMLDITLLLPRQRTEKEGVLVASGLLNGKGRFSRSNPLHFEIELKGEIAASLKSDKITKASQNQTFTVKIYGTDP